jgi:hypothetical protein
MYDNKNDNKYSHLYLKLPKPPFFSYYLLWFFFYKIREQEGGTGTAWRMTAPDERAVCNVCRKTLVDFSQCCPFFGLVPFST